MSSIFIGYYKVLLKLINLLTVLYFKPQMTGLWIVQGLLHLK